MRRHVLLALLTALAVAASAVLAGVLLVSRGGDGAERTAVPAEPAAAAHGARLPPRRTVVVLPEGTPAVAPERQGVDGVELARLRAGSAPSGPTAGVVLTDARCQPDPAGVSHCLNDIRLASGDVLTVVHDHPMATIACLSPGERVDVRPA